MATFQPNIVVRPEGVQAPQIQEPMYVGEPIQPDTPDNFQVEQDYPSESPVVSEETAERRAYQFKYGLDTLLNKSKDDIFTEIVNNGEDNLRMTAASEVTARKRQALSELVQKVTAQKGGALTPEESDGLRQIIANMNKETDPKSVLEESYGRQFVAELDRRGMEQPDSFYNDAKKRYPEETSKITEEASTLAAKRLYAQTAMHNIEAEIKNQGWLPWGADMVKMAVPGYQDYKLRGNAKKTSSLSGIALGENLEAQRKDILRLPMDEYKDQLDKILKDLSADNPTMAHAFAKAIVGMSTSDIALSNVILPIDLAGLGIGKATVKGIRAALKPQLLKDTEKAAKDMVHAVTDPNPSKSGVLEASGDLKEAAIVKVTADAIADTEGLSDPTRKALEALTTTLRTDISDMKANPGHSRELVLRLENEANTANTNLINTVMNIMKVNRLPEIMATETAVRAIQEDIKNTYRGIKNAVIDVSRPIKEDFGDTYTVKMILGNNDGTYFKNRRVAENFIKYHGLKDATVQEGTDKALTKTSKRIQWLENNNKVSQDIIERETKKMENPNHSSEAQAKSQEQIDLSHEAIERNNKELEILRPAQAQVEQQGLGFYVTVTKPLNETSRVIRDLIAETKNTKQPDGLLTHWINAFAGKVRTPEEVLSVANRRNRLLSVNVPAELVKVIKDNSKEIKKLQAGRFSKGRKRWDEFQRAIENGQEIFDPTTKKKGYFFKDIPELQEKYLQWFNRLPDDQEVAAYFEFKRIMEYDRMFRNISEHTKQQRLGAETHSISSFDAAGNEVHSAEFSGITRSTLPGGTDNIVFIGKKLGDERLTNLSKMTTKEKKELQESIDKGHVKLIEIYNTEHRPLNGFGDKINDAKIRYIVTEHSEARALDWNQIPRRGGGHVEYEYDHYIKQANTFFDDIANKYWYEGDTTLMPIQIRSMGIEVAKHLDEVRKLLKAKDEEGARQYSNDNLHIDWDEVHSWFKAGKDEEGKFRKARLNLNERIQLVPKNAQIVDIDNELRFKYGNKSNDSNFRNGTREGNLARLNQTQFSAERDSYDIFTLEDVGSRGQPLYKLAPAKKIEVLTSMNRGLSRIANSNFMDDYKTMSVEHWLKEALPYLQASPSEVWHSPYYYFNEGKFLPNTPEDIIAKYEASKFQINQLISIASATEAKLHGVAQNMADMMYNKFGPKGFVVSPAWVLPKLKDPLAFIRSITFEAKMGLFNIPQFIVQSANYANILGIAGYRMAAPGTLGAQLHFWSRVNSNPAIIKELDKYASKFSMPGAAKWRPGEFEEAFYAMQKTGWGNTGVDAHAILDNPNSTKLVDTKFGTFLEWGRLPFTKGEQNAKYGAWYTAFKEFRDKNPFGRLSEDDIASILQRADLLNINMSRASSSVVHKGIWSIPTQFYTYQLRLMELFYGSRLTGVERARMFLTNSLLYGIPMGTGLTGIPFADYIRQKAMENGFWGATDPYVPQNGAIYTSMMEGIPSMIGAIITGNGDYKAGTLYDFSNRFGTKGFEFLGGFNRSDKTFMDIVGGASYSVMKGALQQSDGFRTAMLALAKGDQEVFPMTPEDLVDPFKVITSVNTAWRTIAAINTSRWMSQNETYLADTSPSQAIFSALSGLKDQKINDIQTKLNSMREQKDYDHEVEKRFQQEFRRGLLLQGDDPEQAKKFFIRARAWLVLGGYREDRMSSILNRAIKDNQSLVDKTDFDFYIRKTPQKRIDLGKESMKTILNLKDKRGE